MENKPVVSPMETNEENSESDSSSTTATTELPVTCKETGSSARTSSSGRSDESIMGSTRTVSEASSLSTDPSTPDTEQAPGILTERKSSADETSSREREKQVPELHRTRSCRESSRKRSIFSPEREQAEPIVKHEQMEEASPQSVSEGSNVSTKGQRPLEESESEQSDEVLEESGSEKSEVVSTVKKTDPSSGKKDKTEPDRDHAKGPEKHPKN